MRKLLVVSSAGGHLCEAMIALEKTKEEDIVYVTNMLPHLKRNHPKNMEFITDPHVSILKYGLNFVSSFKIYLKHRPKVILSTGGGISIGLFILGKTLGSKTIYIESGSRILFPSKTGRLLYHFSDYFFVQSEKLISFYPKAKLIEVL